NGPYACELWTAFLSSVQKTFRGDFVDPERRRFKHSRRRPRRARANQEPLWRSEIRERKDSRCSFYRRTEVAALDRTHAPIAQARNGRHILVHRHAVESRSALGDRSERKYGPAQ